MPEPEFPPQSPPHDTFGQFCQGADQNVYSSIRSVTAPSPVVVTPNVSPRDISNRFEPPVSGNKEQAIPHLPDMIKPKSSRTGGPGGMRLNKFVRRLHDMLQSEKDSGIVEWRRGLLVLHSTDAFAKTILPKYFNTRNFKTFRRQLNYYGFVHVRSFSTTGSTTTALWVNRDLAKHGTASISSVLMLKRVEPCVSARTAEDRRARKEEAVITVEEDIGVSTKSLQLEQIRYMALRGKEEACNGIFVPPIPLDVHCHETPSQTNDVDSDSSSVGSNTLDSDKASKSAANLLLLLSKASSL